MPDTRDPQSVIAAAEQAAVGGDYASAERLLREAAVLQEASLGPMHPELANTLNNLGVVYEVTEKPEEAERCFRRASEIAAAVLPPEHPFVATSRQNLEDFLKTRAKATDAPIPPIVLPPLLASLLPPVPPPVPSPTPPPGVPLATEADHVKSVEASPPRAAGVEAPPVPARASARAVTVGLVLVAASLAAFLANRLWFRGNGAPESTPATANAPPASPAERPTAEAPKLAPTAPAAVKPAPSPAPKAAAAAKSDPARTDRTKSAAIVKPPPIVADVQLCRDLQTGGPASGKWKCNPPGQPVTAGRLVFYTRVKSPTDATVQHRWYRGDRLLKSVDLTIRANPSDGYRTFSRNTVGSGEWRVELRTRDGVLLHEERFTVR